MLYYQTENGTLHQGDVLEVLKTLPSEFVHMVVTSPPYWGLRNYGIKGQIGLEKTPNEYISKMVIIFKEVKRVLRKDGTLWLNIGDSYSSTSKNRSEKQANAKSTLSNPSRNQASILRQQNKAVDGFKLKDMIGIPWRLAFALQADGWYLRQDIIWYKPNPMPESVTDRCTKAHEYIFLLAKSERYFFDNEAIREPQTGNAHDRGRGITPKTAENGLLIKANKSFHKSTSQYTIIPGGRNKRSVWTMTTQSFSEAHFATFPEKLPHTCILAGTSQKGCCPSCGRPWIRILEKESIIKPIGYDGKWSITDPQSNPFLPAKTIGWAPGPGCKCQLESTIPCVVLDPFGGAGTTGLVAEKLGRKWILIELSEAYCKISKKRLEPYTKQFKMKFA